MYRTKLLSSIAAGAFLVAVPVTLPLPVALTSASLVPGASTALAQGADIDISFFFGELEPHGSWVRHDRHRYVWVPDRISVDWSPYTDGRWAYVEEYGWTFVSDEPFAWATYHYGRWAFDRDIGWYWVPGTKWAPAWVSWRRGTDYVGWAPLPPEGDGFAVSIEVNVTDIPEDRWLFVPARDFLAPDLTVVVVERRERPVIFERTEYLGPVVVQNNVIVNNVIDIDFIQERTEREVVVHNIETVEAPDQTVNTSVEGDTIQVFAPEVAEPAEDVAPPEVVEVEEIAQERREQGTAPAAEGEAEADATTETETGTAEETEEAGTEAETETDADAEATADQPAETGTETGTGTETSTETGSETGTEAGAEASGETETGTATDTQTEAETETDTSTEAEATTPSGGESTTGAETETEAEAGQETETQTGTTSETEQPATGTGTEAGAGADADAEVEAETPAAGTAGTETEAGADVEATTEGETPTETSPAEQPSSTEAQEPASADQGETTQEAEEPTADESQAEQTEQEQTPAQECTTEQRAAGQC